MRSTLRFRQVDDQSTCGAAGVLELEYPPPDDNSRQRPAPSVYVAGMEEALRHKWIESQKQGCDVGDAGLKEWFRHHWLPFCRAKRLEHVGGAQRWHEFAEHEFGQVYQLIVDEDLLCDRILDRMECGYDNLEIINWALNWGLPMPRVMAQLLLIDINRARLEPLAPN